MCYIPLTFDPKAVFGKTRAPVTVPLNGYTFRSTIAAMGGLVVDRAYRRHGIGRHLLERAEGWASPSRLARPVLIPCARSFPT